MDIATGPLSTLLPKLANLLQDEYNLQRGAKKGIKFLHDELEFMHAALRKVGELPREELEEQQRIWARDVRELSYDMEDIVDTFMVDIEGPDPPSKKGVKKIFKRMMRKVNKAMARREVAQEINDIKERAKELAERRERYRVDDIAPAKKIPVDPRLHVLYTEATKIVGIEKPKQNVITMLTGGDDDQKKRIVSIAGFGGLGKTTLAKVVHDEIQEKFDCTAFVSVSRDPDTRKLLKDMLYQLDGKKFMDIHRKKLDERLLIDEAIKFLKNKRYLIVIDDIWAEDPWDKIIRLALIENNMGSRIITTTRIIDVAKHIGGCYRLKPLSNESSEILFYGRIFGSKGKCPSQFSEVSKKILKKCGGIPLAIVTMSSMLANKSENIEDWKKVCDSIGSGLGGSNASMDDMRKILLLSYYDLSSNLKTCLLYLSIFPEDYVITKHQLIWRWVAEGFIQKKDQSVFEIAENYFNELLNRSMILSAGEEDMEGKPNACRMHDTVLDLIISLSEENCFVSTKLGDGMESKVRRLSLHNSTSWPTMNMPKLRSLTMFYHFSMFKPGGVVTDPTISSYRLLRVLDLQGCKVKDLASLRFVGSLSHLRYLGLPKSNKTVICTPPDQLPIEIGKLRFLQTLDLSESFELPSSVTTGLGQLICLCGWRPFTPVLKEQLWDSHDFESAVLDHLQCSIEALGHLIHLRVLDGHVNFILGFENMKRACANALVESIGKLKKIESIEIRGSFEGAILDGSMEELSNLHRLHFVWSMFLPTWVNPATLPALSYLDVKVFCERREDIRVLGTLLCLRHLKFEVTYPAPGNEEAFKRCAVGAPTFPCVVSCDFDVEGEHVVPSTFPQGAMPRLQHFTFSISCTQFVYRGGGLSSVDDLGLGHLLSLRSVTVALNLHGWSQDDKPIKDRIQMVREKLEREAALHPNHPLRINFERR